MWGGGKGGKGGRERGRGEKKKRNRVTERLKPAL